MSAATSALKVGVAADPVVGPAQTKLAVCVAKERAKVPEPVTGLPDTERMLEGALSPTLVTVPPEPICGGQIKLAITFPRL